MLNQAGPCGTVIQASLPHQKHIDVLCDRGKRRDMRQGVSYSRM